MNRVLIFIMVFTRITYCGHAQSSSEIDNLGIDSTNRFMFSKTDIAIFNGDIDEYKKYANNYYYAGEPDSLFHNMILYSYFMAERYGNAYAAYNCFYLLGGLSNIPQDSSLTFFLLHLLEIGASVDTSCADMAEIGCAYYLSNWYNGREYIEPDPIKQHYYKEKANAMARCRKRRLDKTINKYENTQY